jgi:hypothetical protein
MLTNSLRRATSVRFRSGAGSNGGDSARVWQARRQEGREEFNTCGTLRPREHRSDRRGEEADRGSSSVRTSSGEAQVTGPPFGPDTNTRIERPE